jgi:hypothetical protein
MTRFTIALAAVLALGSTAMAQNYSAAGSRAQVQVESGTQAFARAGDIAIVAPAHVNPAEY